MSKNKIKLNIVSQEKELLSTEVDWVMVPTINGVITILPQHISLFAQISTGTLTYKIDDEEHLVVVSKGFVDVFPDSKVVIMIDSGVLARDISEKKAQEAIDAAKETMKTTADNRQLILAEASLRQAMLELNIARKTKKSRYK